MNNLTPEQRARIVRAKAHELEGRSLERGVEDELGYLVADVALLFDLLAEHLEEHLDDERRYERFHDRRMMTPSMYTAKWGDE